MKASTLNKNDVDVLKALAAAYVAQSSALQTQITALQNQASLVQAGALARVDAAADGPEHARRRGCGGEHADHRSR